ncbi:MAG: hypothetical protein AAGC95_01375 [Pseudomonadota bacterium]
MRASGLFSAMPFLAALSISFWVALSIPLLAVSSIDVKSPIKDRHRALAETSARDGVDFLFPGRMMLSRFDLSSPFLNACVFAGSLGMNCPWRGSKAAAGRLAETADALAPEEARFGAKKSNDDVSAF